MLANKVRDIDNPITTKTSLKFIFEGNLDKKYISGENNSCPKKFEIKFLNDSILIDFNRAYNPKCVYDENFSCPIVPRDNMLDLRIESGVKNFFIN